jgi:hypothetical protein
MGEWIIDPCSLDLGSRWRWLVSFTPRPPYPRGKNPQCPLDTRLCGPQIRSGRCEEEKKRPARSQSLHRLRYPGASRWQDNIKINAWLMSVIIGRILYCKHARKIRVQ